MKRLILAVTVTLTVLGAWLFGNYQQEQQALIESKTVVAYQVAYDGEMQVTFADGGTGTFNNMYDILDFMDEIHNHDFIMELEECYEGHPTVIKAFLTDLSIMMEIAEL